jgi:hypothetical protein
MENPELTIIAINIAVLAVAYFYVYPRYCGPSLNKVAMNDIAASGIPLLIAGLSFWDSGVEFNLLITAANWFWFTLVTYAIIEAPLTIWYFNKYKISTTTTQD